jgi:hypothetical protein
MQELLCLEDRLWIVTEPIGSPTYDFPFERFFRCTHPLYPPPGVRALARVGARSDYAALVEQLASEGIGLWHGDEEHQLAADLRGWYPRLHDLTPKTIVFDDWPDSEVVEAELGWPTFLKGVRQTSRHRLHTARVEGPQQLESLREVYRCDRVLGWQPVACRQWVPLRTVPDPGWDGVRIPASFEFRCFFWRKRLVGFGNYWAQASYEATRLERESICCLAQRAADRLDVPFLVVDVAQGQDGKWWVIECNDGQESGYAGVSPLAVWNGVVEVERES